MTLVVPTTFEPEFLEKLNGFPVSSLTARFRRSPAAGREKGSEWILRAVSIDGNSKPYGESIDRLVRKFTSGSFKAPLTRSTGSGSW